jgi:ribosome-associated translation inhibitor RaiA
MQVLVHSDHHTQSAEDVSARVESIVTDAVDRFADRITRVDVHLSDTNGDKHGERDKRCMIEARVAGVAPVAVHNEAPTMRAAIDGAADKLQRALEHSMGRLAAGTRRGPRASEIVETDVNVDEESA